MLLTLFAIIVGSLIGRIRGGRWSGVTEARLEATPLLVVAISTILVQAVLDPIFPFLWSLVSTLCLIGFFAKNRHLTGATVLIIGAVLNLFPLLLNGATPVSELALLSVGDVDPFGFPEIDGARESSTTAGRLRFLGDAIPVPLFGTVVSIGDLIILVGLGDIFTNLLLTKRERELEFDEAGVTFATEPNDSATDVRVPILSPLETGDRQQSVRGQRQKAAPNSHVPAHAASEDVIDLTEAQPASSSGHIPAHAAEPIAVELRDEPLVVDLEVAEAPALGAHADASPTPSLDARRAEALANAANQALAVTPTASPTPAVDVTPEIIDLTDPNDPRPIIDLTNSPTDAQMAEFLRRRKSADRDHYRVAVRPPGQRRGRAPARNSVVLQERVVEQRS